MEGEDEEKIVHWEMGSAYIDVLTSRIGYIICICLIINLFLYILKEAKIKINE